MYFTSALCRSLGDYSYKTARDLGPTEQLISPEPEITVIDRQPEHDQMVVLACDGVWDVVSNEDLCRVVSERMRSVGDLSRVCNEVIDYCLYNVSPRAGAGLSKPQISLKVPPRCTIVQRLTNF